MNTFKFIRGLFGKKDRRKKEMEEWQNFLMELEEVLRLEEIEEMEEERKKRKFKALCEFFERRGYEFYTRTPMVKMGGLYPDLREFMPPTGNRSWQRKVVQLYPSQRW